MGDRSRQRCWGRQGRVDWTTSRSFQKLQFGSMIRNKKFGFGSTMSYPILPLKSADMVFRTRGIRIRHPFGPVWGQNDSKQRFSSFWKIYFLGQVSYYIISYHTS